MPADMKPASTDGRRRSAIHEAWGNTPTTMKVTAASVTLGWFQASSRRRRRPSRLRTAMKRQFCRLKAVGARVAHEISVRMRSSSSSRAGSKALTELRCAMASVRAWFMAVVRSRVCAGARGGARRIHAHRLIECQSRDNIQFDVNIIHCG
ncbi:hypothetical protein D3C71_1588000 [compost metagenome]